MKYNTQGLIKKGLFHSIHNSERKSFGCKRAWSWRYRGGYAAPTPAPALEFGTAWHAAMEVWYAPADWTANRDKQAGLAKKRFIEVTDQQLKNYLQHNPFQQDSEIARRNEECKLGLAMLDYYINRVSPKLDVDLTPIAVETSFEIPLDLYCRCDSCWDLWYGTLEYEQDVKGFRDWGIHFDLYKEAGWSGLPLTFGGTIDAIFLDPDGKVLVTDWKTCTKLLEEDAHPWLDLDTQVEGYCAALWKSGKQCDGFIYHEQRKSVPETPRLLDRPYRGRLVSTNKEAPVEYPTAVKFIKEHDPEGMTKGLYNDYFWYLRSHEAPKFYQRIPIYKTETQLENFWEALQSEVQDMIREVLDPYPQPQRFKCLGCEFRKPCDMKNRGEDYLSLLNTKYLRG